VSNGLKIQRRKSDSSFVGGLKLAGGAAAAAVLAASAVAVVVVVVVVSKRRKSLSGRVFRGNTSTVDSAFRIFFLGKTFFYV